MLHYNMEGIMKDTKRLVVYFKKLADEAILPNYAKPGDMGMDITAISMEYDKTRDCFIYHTGWAVEIPEGYGMFIAPRSSNRNTEAYLPNHVAIIDSGYRGEVLICFKNRTRLDNTPPYNVGDRVAQLVIMPYPLIAPFWTENLSETERGIGGHGSTGK